jgi:CBS domain-containing protein
MAAVSDLLAKKGRVVHTIFKTATVFEAISKMVANNVGALVVVDQPALVKGDAEPRRILRERPCGMITERDYLRRVAIEGRASRSTFVQEIMSSDLCSVEPGTDVEECMKIISNRRIRHLPVMRGTSLVGLVSIGDIVRSLARERKHQIEELTAYIQGRYS